MSIRRLPREMGIWVVCDGSDHEDCEEKRFTANVYAKVNRVYLAMEGWGRGLRTDRKRRDQCPYHYKLEKFLFWQWQWRRALDKEARDERRKAEWAEKQEAKKAEAATNPPKPKKPRKKKAPLDTSSIPAPSPSEVSAPAPSM